MSIVRKRSKFRSAFFQSLIFRYLAKEVFITLTALIVILLFIFMSNQFIQYLNRAAQGQIPIFILFKLMLLELPNLMSLLLPLGFYVAVIIAYGRLYADSEMTVLMACGYSPWQLLKHTLVLASFLAVFVGIIMLWISPNIAVERAKLLRNSGVETLIQTLSPGRFQTFSHDQAVLYFESMNNEKTLAQNVFLAKFNPKSKTAAWTILYANKARVETDKATQAKDLVLENGHEYEGSPGQSESQVVDFATAKQRLPHPEISVRNDLRTRKTSALWPWVSDSPKKAAELQWRLSIPLMVFTLAVVAVPLSRVNPRSGKFAKLFTALLIFIVYADLLFVLRGWIGQQKIPIWFGMWGLHLSVFTLGLYLIWKTKLKYT